MKPIGGLSKNVLAAVFTLFCMLGIL